MLRSQKVKDLIDLQLATGDRLGELLMLTTAMIDRSGKTWTTRLEHHKTEHRGKIRVLAFGPKAQLPLGKYLQEDQPKQPLFRIRRNTYSNIVRSACKRAEIFPFVPHELRHTSATLIRDRFGSDAGHAGALQAWHDGLPHCPIDCTLRGHGREDWIARFVPSLG